MQRMRIVVSNEPRSYREVIAAALRALRPQFEIITVDPADLDHAAIRLKPHVAVCSRLSPVVQRHSLAWIVLYPAGKTQAVISVGQHSLTVGDIEFTQVLAAIDQAERLIEETRSPI